MTAASNIIAARKATEVPKQVPDGAEGSGRRQIMVTVIANGVND